MRAVRIAVAVAFVGALVIAGHEAEAKPPPIPFASCPLLADQAGRTYKLTGQPLSCAATGITVTAANVTIDLGGFVWDGDSGATDVGIKAVGAGAGGLRVRNGVIQEFDYGIEIDPFDGKGAVVTDVTVMHNMNDGIFANGVKRHVFKRVTAYDNGGNGIRSLNTATVTGSQAIGNNSNGFSIGGTGSVVSRSNASSNDSTGITISGAGSRVVGSTANVNGFTTIGIGIQVSGAQTRVLSNNAHGNALGGITVFGDKAVINKNRADGNGWQVDDTTGLGIHATTFTTAPIGKNRAEGNDDPNQCNPVNLC